MLPYFLNTKDNQHYTSITSQQLSQCKGTTILFCSFNIALTASASASCLSAVFFNHKEAVSKMCDFRFLTNMLPIAMYELSPSHLLLYRTTIIALDCANGQRILKGCSFCVVKIPCLSSVTSNSLYLPPCNNVLIRLPSFTQLTWPCSRNSLTRMLTQLYLETPYLKNSFTSNSQGPSPF